MGVRLFRARVAVLLTRLAYMIAPELTLSEREALARSVNWGEEPWAQQARLRVDRPGGLSTTHGPPAPWAD